MTDHICYACFEDSVLRERVQRVGGVDECRVCEERREGISVEQLAEWLEPVMRENLGWGREVPYFGEGDSDSVSYRRLGDPLEHWVQNFLGQYFDFQNEIIDAVIESEFFYPGDGGEPFWDETMDYEEVRHSGGEFGLAWQETLQDVRHRRRFFSEKAHKFFAELFADVEHMHLPGKPRSPVVRTLRTGTRLFRARVVTSSSLLTEMVDDPLAHIGPPPPHLARAGRMNAEGISVFYASLESPTCLAEMRPAIGNDIALIELRTNRPLRVLDFERLETARSSKPLSYFQPDYQKQLKRRNFLKILHTLIAQPVTPGHESDYLITQTMAEFLSHVAAPSFDGILFKSTQRQNGTNIVLFPNAVLNEFGEPLALPVSLAAEKVNLFRTQSISYAHVKLDFYRPDDANDVIVFQDDEPHPDDTYSDDWPD
ncbi:RES family NAD+ phosphorylase [Paraburkholderia tagetis]|uniref:RES family NAD+ phosphorylase n=1 Tax=Paraburkholderia tagetis TaxID=2913261 RepID=A0A9X1ZXL0_9BURK|nr:RES family NAD+ phosphorylase [Paraburkholderia tagetis]MCG5077823.1 RES family NAD+ phosphorylase [Paraburkholderia tagetis]